MREEEMIVSYSCCGSSGKMNIPSVLTFFQDLIDRHVFGYPIQRQIELNILWVAISWKVEVKRFPSCEEVLKVRTYLNTMDKFFSRRTFCIIDENGETVAAATANLVFCNRETGRPARMTPEYIADHDIDEEAVYEYMPLSDRTKYDCLDECGEFTVMRHDIDINRHMNNVSYVRNALNFIDIEFEPKFMQIYYETPTYLGDIIKVFKGTLDGKTVIQLKKGEKVAATVLFG